MLLSVIVSEIMHGKYSGPTEYNLFIIVVVLFLLLFLSKHYLIVLISVKTMLI